MLRLRGVHELNIIRVIFRLLFLVPILILSADGLRPHHHVNENMFATDFLGIIAGLGCVVQSAITLIIFFPRDRSTEYHRHKRGSRASANQNSSSGSSESGMSMRQDPPVLPVTGSSLPPAYKQDLTLLSDEDNYEFADEHYEMPPIHVRGISGQSPNQDLFLPESGWLSPETIATKDRLEPNRRMDLEVLSMSTRSHSTLQRLTSPKTWVHPVIKNFESPLDLSLDQRRRRG